MLEELYCYKASGTCLNRMKREWRKDRYVDWVHWWRYQSLSPPKLNRVIIYNLTKRWGWKKRWNYHIRMMKSQIMLYRWFKESETCLFNLVGNLSRVSNFREKVLGVGSRYHGYYLYTVSTSEHRERLCNPS